MPMLESKTLQRPQVATAAGGESWAGEERERWARLGEKNGKINGEINQGSDIQKDVGREMVPKVKPKPLTK